MSSNYYLVIRLEPHYQQFLRAHFACETEIFEFPERNEFNGYLETYVVQKRYGIEVPETDKDAFKIMLPVFHKKNPAFFRYLTESKEMVFKSLLKQHYDRVIRRRIEELMSVPGKSEAAITKPTRKDCTLIVIDEFGFDLKDDTAYDRIYKLYTRYLQNDRWDSYQMRKLKKKALSLKNPEC